MLVTRPAGSHDDLWLVNPEDGSSIASGSLPGHAGTVAPAPDGLAVAYLPANGAAKVWITDGAEVRTIGLQTAGVKRVQGVAWLGTQQLVVSGAPRNTLDPLAYRLYLLDLDTGTVRSYRGLSGVDPSARAGKLVYVDFVRLSGGTRPLVRERLKLLSTDGAGAGRIVATVRYRISTGRRSFSHPLLSADTQWLLADKTGSSRVTYSVMDRAGTSLLTLFSPSAQAGAWDATSARVAMGGMVPTAGTNDACVWVSDVTGGTVLRTPAGLMGDVSITSLAWSPTGTRLAAEATGSDVQSVSRHLFVLPADLTWFRDLGEGALPVWIVQ